MNLNIFKEALKFLQKNAPTILTVTAVGGVIATSVLAVKATPEAYKKLEKAKEVSKDGCISSKEIVKICWKDYIPATTMGIATVSCIVAASTVNSKRQAALSAAYILTSSTFDEYKNKVVETIGEKKHKRIEKEMVEEKAIDKTDLKPTQLIVSEPETHVCFDCWSGRYFTSSMEQLRRIENEANRDLLDRLWLSLNDIYYRLGMEPVKMGDNLGWDVERGKIEFRYAACLSPKDEPVITIDFTVDPKY